ncbi:MAG: hypothetical protein P1U47_08750 [Zhongshania sp.]|uniref:hypothetical protein n=1 Tax=Zhongshania sp. TaxID=1971902 RepID=UPI002635A51E|nr:hypothetical protein [Zhongshania sp.]MDF1692446.1 hypothetical protein [Zhongshania sp.]
MHIETMQEMVEWSAAYHQSFAGYLQDSMASSSDERAKMLSDYIADHERSLAKTLYAFKPTHSDGALGTWCAEFLNDKPLPNTEKTDVRWSKMSADEMFAEVSAVHAQLIDLYRFLLSRCMATPAAEMLQQLIDVEEQEIKLMAQSANRLHEM